MGLLSIIGGLVGGDDSENDNDDEERRRREEEKRRKQEEEEASRKEAEREAMERLRGGAKEEIQNEAQSAVDRATASIHQGAQAPSFDLGALNIDVGDAQEQQRQLASIGQIDFEPGAPPPAPQATAPQTPRAHPPIGPAPNHAPDRVAPFDPVRADRMMSEVQRQSAGQGPSDNNAELQRFLSGDPDTRAQGGGQTDTPPQIASDPVAPPVQSSPLSPAGGVAGPVAPPQKDLRQIQAQADAAAPPSHQQTSPAGQDELEAARRRARIMKAVQGILRVGGAVGSAVAGHVGAPDAAIALPGALAGGVSGLMDPESHVQDAGRVQGMRERQAGRDQRAQQAQLTRQDRQDDRKQRAARDARDFDFREGEAERRAELDEQRMGHAERRLASYERGATARNDYMASNALMSESRVRHTQDMRDPASEVSTRRRQVVTSELAALPAAHELRAQFTPERLEQMSAEELDEISQTYRPTLNRFARRGGGGGGGAPQGDEIVQGVFAGVDLRPGEGANLRTAIGEARASVQNLQGIQSIAREHGGLAARVSPEARALLAPRLSAAQAMVARVKNTGIINPSEVPAINAALPNPQDLEQMTFGQVNNRARAWQEVLWESMEGGLAARSVDPAGIARVRSIVFGGGSTRTPARGRQQSSEPEVRQVNNGWAVVVPGRGMVPFDSEEQAQRALEQSLSRRQRR